ncbi:MAG: methyltransferase domain-containing protein [Nanoarchaeota archaeon]
MVTLLFPGRHLLNTRFQEEYLYSVLQRPLKEVGIWGDSPLRDSPHTLDSIVFAITSANQANSRYNPIPFHVRAIGVDRFARQFRETLGISYRILGVPDFKLSPKFSEYMLQEIEEQSEGSLELTPQNTIVLCSTPEVIKQYLSSGFLVLPAELESLSPVKYFTDTPMSLVKKIVEIGENWATHPEVRSKLSPSTLGLWRDFPEVPEKVFRLYRDPLLNDSGSLTDTRDYSTYARGMSGREVIHQKYTDIKNSIIPGKIVDEGCADGALLTLIAQDFTDSDLIGIELTGEFIARCQERQRAGEFGGTYVHFHQRNLMDGIFEENSIDTTICNSTTHELWSYGEQETTLQAYLKLKLNQTKRGGRILIRDVVGPEDKQQEVYMWCNEQDGSNEDVFKECSGEELVSHLRGLSTYSRFHRFSRDYLADRRNSGHRGEETKVKYREEVVDGKKFIVLDLKTATEFMTKKDYVDNWKSELNEEFSFWDFSEWKSALKDAGFVVLENPNDIVESSRTYANSWIVQNRYVRKVELYQKTEKSLKQMEYPVTNMVLVGEKR